MISLRGLVFNKGGLSNLTTELGYTATITYLPRDQDNAGGADGFCASLWFSAQLFPLITLFILFLRGFYAISKSLHRQNGESGKKCVLMNFVVSSEQLKGERLRLEFTVNNLLHLRFWVFSASWRKFRIDSVVNCCKRTIGRFPASINQTLRRPLISVQNCNYFRTRPPQE